MSALRVHDPERRDGNGDLLQVENLITFLKLHQLPIQPVNVGMLLKIVPTGLVRLHQRRIKQCENGL